MLPFPPSRAQRQVRLFPPHREEAVASLAFKLATGRSDLGLATDAAIAKPEPYLSNASLVTVVGANSTRTRTQPSRSESSMCGSRVMTPQLLMLTLIPSFKYSPRPTHRACFHLDSPTRSTVAVTGRYRLAISDLDPLRRADLSAFSSTLSSPRSAVLAWARSCR